MKTRLAFSSAAVLLIAAVVVNFMARTSGTGSPTTVAVRPQPSAAEFARAPAVDVRAGETTRVVELQRR